MRGRIRNNLLIAIIMSLLALPALFFSCEQAAGPFVPAQEEKPEPGTPEPGKPVEEPDPLTYAAAANGVNGEEDSTVILFTFDEDVADLSAEQISLTNDGGVAAKGDITGSGKEWSLAIAVQKAGTVTVSIKKDGIAEGEKPVTVYRAAEKTLITFNAATDGSSRRASLAINFTFGAAIAELSAEDITIVDDTGSVAPGALSGGGQNWSLGIAVDVPGDIRVGIARGDIETGERILTVYKPIVYSVTTDGESGVAASSKIEFAFTAEPTGLSAEDISVSPADIVTKGALTGSGTSWSLGITALKDGDIQVSIHKDGIEDAEKTLGVYHYVKPISYTATANGVNGEEDSTAITLVFDGDAGGLRAGHIGLANGEDDAGGSVVKGSLDGSGKEWSLGIAVQTAGSIRVTIDKAGIETGEKPVTVYKAAEQTLINYSAIADGDGRRASSALNITFGAAIADLSAEDIAIVDDTGSVTKGALSGEGQSWSLGIAVQTPGSIRVAIHKAGIETGEKTVAVHKPIAYSAAADGEDGVASSTKIDFSFAAEVAGLTTGDISVVPADSVTIDALAGVGTSWSLGIVALKAGDIQVRIHRDGIEDGEKTLTLRYYRPVSYTVIANGVNGEVDSTALVFSFDEAITDLRSEHLRLANGTGSVVMGSLAGSGKQWSLGIAVQEPGSVTIAIDKTGVAEGEKTVDVYKAAEQTLVSYTATANGGGKTASSVIALSFGAAVTLTAADIVVAEATGSVKKGALSGSGKNWSLGITVETPGDIRVSIAKDGIEEGEKTVTVHKPVTYAAAADILAGSEASGRIDFIFSEAVEGLNMGNIRYADDTGSAYPMELSGGGEDWSLTLVTIKTGNIKVSINKEGIEDTEKLVAVYKPEEVPPPVPEKTGIIVMSPPDTVLYAKNQSFDRTGLELGWVYSDGTVEPIPAGGYKLEEPDMAIPVAKRVNVQAGGYKTSFWIQVLNSTKVLSYITAEGPTNKIQYYGKEFDRAGLVVTGHYSDGSSASLANLASIVGYDKFKRGPQEVSVRVNGKTAALEGITTRIGDDALMSVVRLHYGDSNNTQGMNYKDIYIKGEAMTPRGSNIKFHVSPSGKWDGFYTNIISLDNGGLTEQDFDTLTGYNPYQIGWQTLSMTIDGRQFSLYVHVVDTEPAVWFDYGYWRHDGDPNGRGPGAGKYYAKPNETLVIAPVRYLLGYNADHSDAGASYTWTVSGDNSSRTYTTSNNGELLHITPKAAGTYTITVAVTGRHYVAGSVVTKTASAEVVCYNTSLPAGTFVSPLKHFACGQFTIGGTGLGWSLGSAGGYEIWTVDHQASYRIEGNAFGVWLEGGVVWMQEDNNGNGLPDEMWYELRGGDEDDSAWKNYIARRYAITYFKGNGTNAQHGIGDGTNPRAAYWVDSKGRAGLMPGGFPTGWGVTGDWVTYTCTMLRDDGNFAIGSYSKLANMLDYVDAAGYTFPVNKAMNAAGTPVTLTAVKFIKVQTAILFYGGLFGEVSTEIQYADFLGTQSDFPKP
jgi:hypothetical protein